MSTNKNLHTLLDEEYELNVEFHEYMRESIYCFATAIYDETLPFKEWVEKHYGKATAKHNITRVYTKQDVIEELKKHIEHPTKPGYRRHDILNRIKELEK